MLEMLEVYYYVFFFVRMYSWASPAGNTAPENRIQENFFSTFSREVTCFPFDDTEKNLYDISINNAICSTNLN